jgi:hypothetical protein
MGRARRALPPHQRLGLPRRSTETVESAVRSALWAGSGDSPTWFSRAALGKKPKTVYMV